MLSEFPVNHWIVWSFMVIPDSHISPDHKHCKVVCLFASALVTVKIAQDGTLKMSVDTGLGFLLQGISIRCSRRKRGKKIKSDRQRSYHAFSRMTGPVTPTCSQIQWNCERPSEAISENPSLIRFLWDTWRIKLKVSEFLYSKDQTFHRSERMGSNFFTMVII